MMYSSLQLLLSRITLQFRVLTVNKDRFHPTSSSFIMPEDNGSPQDIVGRSLFLGCSAVALVWLTLSSTGALDLLKLE